MDFASAAATDYYSEAMERSVASFAVGTTEKATLMVIVVPFVRPVMIAASWIAAWIYSLALGDRVVVLAFEQPRAASA